MQPADPMVTTPRVEALPTELNTDFVRPLRPGPAEHCTTKRKISYDSKCLGVLSYLHIYVTRHQTFNGIVCAAGPGFIEAADKNSCIFSQYDGGVRIIQGLMPLRVSVSGSFIVGSSAGPGPENRISC